MSRAIALRLLGCHRSADPSMAVAEARRRWIAAFLAYWRALDGDREARFEASAQFKLWTLVYKTTIAAFGRER
jgi:hypothetical protein